MTRLLISTDDRAFKSAFEACAVAPGDFDHRLLDSRIMLKHYSAEVLWSAAAREQFVTPDVRPIPEH